MRELYFDDNSSNEGDIPPLNETDHPYVGT